MMLSAIPSSASADQRVRGEQQAEAELAWAGRPFVNRDLPARTLQRETGRQTANACAHDDRLAVAGDGRYDGTPVRRCRYIALLTLKCAPHDAPCGASISTPPMSMPACIGAGFHDSMKPTLMNASITGTKLSIFQAGELVVPTMKRIVCVARREPRERNEQIGPQRNGHVLTTSA
jgi:hypothetical protein